MTSLGYCVRFSRPVLRSLDGELVAFTVYQAVIGVVAKAHGAGVLVHGEDDSFPPTVAGIVLLC